eukprot:TRINITY_DN7172_c0_g1_i1.p1 TRINITY_DN7172_c0_g1~~TRINITY_DN7172_c0_g1_i1.p1  ORF type:complete len:654 (+),score=160.78 TRINITY_DN7172_c0_g1_i1:257-1963(+)
MELEKVEGNVKGLVEGCEGMARRLEATKVQSGSLLKRAEEIYNANAQNEAQRVLIAEFLSRFQLSEEEGNYLLKPVEIEDVRFFEILKKVRHIHNQCKVLLRTQHQRAGLEIMDNMSEYMESAYKKLYRWVKNECRSLDKELPEISSLLPEAFASLQERPVLMSYCLDEVGETRNKVVKRSYLLALTQGGPSGIPRPIELHAHDPRRYVGDMAAWIHQALASESELISSLLRRCNSETEEQKRKYDENKAKTLNKCLSDVCLPFKTRALQVLTSKLGLSTTYHLATLLQFYKNNFLKLLGPGSTLVKTFAECREEMMKFFFSVAKKQLERLESVPPIPPIDLSPPHEILEAVHISVEILGIIDYSYVNQEEQIAECAQIVQATLMPLIEVTIQSTPSLSGIPKCIYILNCTSLIKGALEGRHYGSAQLELLNAHIEKVLTDLIKFQASSILEDCGIASLISNINKAKSSYAAGQPLSSMPTMDINTISKVLRMFDSKLLDLGTMSMSMIDKLQSQQLRFQVRLMVSSSIHSAYSDLYNILLDPSNGFPNPETLFRYKPDQVKNIIDPS